MNNVKFHSPSREEVYRALNPRDLELVILPTEDCNFRCTYCYEDHVRGRMSQDTINGIKRLIESRLDDLKFLRISWFGGEPLSVKDIVFEVGEYAYRRCREHGVEFAGDVTTNGYTLTVPVMKQLAAASHKQFFVSLAGFGADHDRLRPLASGKGSFERIWENLTALRDSDIDFNISLRLHFGPDVSICEALCRQVNEQFGDDSRFQASLQRIADLGGENTGKFATVSAEDARAVIWRLASLMPDVCVSDLYPRKSPICCAAKPNSMVIRTDGQLGRCLAHLNDPRNFVGRLAVDGRMEIDGQSLQPWFKGFDELDGRMLSCPVVSIPSDLWAQNAQMQPFPIDVVAGAARGVR